MGRMQGHQAPSPPAALAPKLKPPRSFVDTHTNPCRGSSFAFCLGPRPHPPGLRFLLCKEGTAPLTSQGYESKMRRPVCTQMLSVCSLKGILSNSNLCCPLKKVMGDFPVVQGLRSRFHCRSLAGELRFCLPCGVAKKNNK